MLRPHEREALERLERVGNPLGWKPHGRNENGDAILHARLSRGAQGGHRDCYVTLAPMGSTHGSVEYDDNGTMVRKRGLTYE